MPVDTITFTPVTPAQARDPRLRGQLLDTWVRVTDAGGAVGFVAPSDPVLIAPTLDAALRRIVSGRLGIEGFYAHLGYKVFGRNPRAIRVADGDERDEIHMRCTL